MERKEKKESLLEWTAQALDIPAQAAGLPRVELVGRHELRMENHRGILAYSPEDIHIGGGKMAIRVRGLGLELTVMNRSELLITGQIASIELE